MPRTGRREACARFLASPPGRGGLLAAAVVLAAGAAWCLAFAGGYFLSDDFVQLANFGHWEVRGRLGHEVLRRFYGSIDEVNGFWRPLTFASFALSHELHGAWAPGWIAANLALHLANAFLVGRLVVLLAAEPSRAALAAALAAGTFFFVFSPGWEVALWIACRYDSAALFFSLLAGLAFLRDRRGWALAASAAALASKEAGAAAIVFVALLAAMQVLARPGGESLARRSLAWLRIVAPWIVLGAAYAALRFAIFGSPTRVYVEARVDLFSLEHWRHLAVSGLAFGRQVFPGIPGIRGLVAASLVALGFGTALAARRGTRPLLALGVALASMAATLALLLPHVGGFEMNGIGGRLLYQAAAFYAMALGLALHEALRALAGRALAAAAVLAAMAVLLAANASWGWRAARHYADAQGSMRAAAAAIGGLAARGAPADYALVVLPDAFGRAPFARNAQAGLMLPRVQGEPLTAKLLVQTDAELWDLDTKIDGGLFAALRRHSLHDLMENRAGPGPWPRFAPTAYYCWSAPSRTLRPLEVDGAAPGVGARVASAYAAAGCGDAARK